MDAKNFGAFLAQVRRERNMSFGTPLTRLMRLVLDLLFFFCFGFLLPCVEAWLILLN